VLTLIGRVQLLSAIYKL